MSCDEGESEPKTSVKNAACHDIPDNNEKNNKFTNNEPLIVGKIRRKRSRNPDMWFRNQQQRKRLSGQEYKTRSGNTIQAKVFVDKPCNCSKNCNSKISSEDREACFNSFYSLNSQTEQNVFIREYVLSSATERHRPTTGTPVKMPKSHTFSYFMRVDNEIIKVCKKYFRETYQISDGRIYSCCIKNVVTHSIFSCLYKSEKDSAENNDLKCDKNE